MNEAEMLEIAHLSMSNMLASFAILLSLISGYLIVAHTAGQGFSRLQVSIVNLLFLLMSVAFMFGVYGYCQSAVDMSLAANELNPERTYRGSKHFPVVTLFLNSFAISSSLYFMWHVRNASSENT